MQPSVYTDLDRLLRSPGGAYIALVALIALWLVCWFVISPWLERLVVYLGFDKAPRLGTASSWRGTSSREPENAGARHRVRDTGTFPTADPSSRVMPLWPDRDPVLAEREQNSAASSDTYFIVGYPFGPVGIRRGAK